VLAALRQPLHAQLDAGKKKYHIDIAQDNYGKLIEPNVLFSYLNTVVLLGSCQGMIRPPLTCRLILSKGALRFLYSPGLSKELPYHNDGEGYF